MKTTYLKFLCLLALCLLPEWGKCITFADSEPLLAERVVPVNPPQDKKAKKQKKRLQRKFLHEKTPPEITEKQGKKRLFGFYLFWSIVLGLAFVISIYALGIYFQVATLIVGILSILIAAFFIFLLIQLPQKSRSLVSIHKELIVHHLVLAVVCILLTAFSLFVGYGVGVLSYGTIPYINIFLITGLAILSFLGLSIFFFVKSNQNRRSIRALKSKEYMKNH